MNFDAINLNALKPLIPIPMVTKLLILVISVGLIFVAYFLLFLTPLNSSIEAGKVQLESQRVQLQKNKVLASNIPKKKAEYKKLKTQLKIALNMLPRKSQIPDLLEGVTWAGRDSGLSFSEFKPETESVQSIYAEVPVTLAVAGTFKQLLTFLKRVGEMSRIVDVKNLELRVLSDQKLSIKGQAVTYRFVDSGKKTNKKKTSGR